MRVAGRRRLAALRQLLQRVGADRLQHREARLPIRVGRRVHESLVDQRRHPVQDVARARADGHRLGRLQGEAADEDGQPAEQRPLLAGQQVVAPGDRVAQGPLPRRGVARAPRQQGQAVRQPGQQGRRSEHLGAGRRQLDRQRQAVEGTADPGDRRRVLGGEGKARTDGPGALHEEGDRLAGRQLRQRGKVPGSGIASGGTGNSCSPPRRNAPRPVARIVRARGRRRGGRRRRARRRRPARRCRARAGGASRQGRGQALAYRPVARLRHADRAGDGREHPGGVAQRREVDEDDAVGEVGPDRPRPRAAPGASSRRRRARSG